MTARGHALTEVSDKELVVAFQRGDRAAYDEIYRRHLPRIRRVCRRMLSNSQDVEEAVQETFMKAYQALGRFNGSYLVGPWLARIASNVCVDQLRSGSRGATVVPLAPDDDARHAERSPEDFVIGLDPRVDSAIHGIQPLHARVLALRAVEGLSHREIAGELQMSPAQVKALLHRARESFRRAWDRAEGWLLAPVGIVRSLWDESSRGLTTTSQGWTLTSLVSSSHLAAEKIAAAAVAATLALTATGGIPTFDRPQHDAEMMERSVAPVHDSAAISGADALRRIELEDAALVADLGAERPRERSGSLEATGSTPGATSAPVAEDAQPEPPRRDPAGGDREPPPEPPIGPSGAGNTVRTVLETADEIVDQLPLPTP